MNWQAGNFIFHARIYCGLLAPTFPLWMVTLMGGLVDPPKPYFPLSPHPIQITPFRAPFLAERFYHRFPDPSPDGIRCYPPWQISRVCSSLSQLLYDESSCPSQVPESGAGVQSIQGRGHHQFSIRRIRVLPLTLFRGRTFISFPFQPKINVPLSGLCNSSRPSVLLPSLMRRLNPVSVTHNNPTPHHPWHVGKSLYFVSLFSVLVLLPSCLHMLLSHFGLQWRVRSQVKFNPSLDRSLWTRFRLIRYSVIVPPMYAILIYVMISSPTLRSSLPISSWMLAVGFFYFLPVGWHEFFPALLRLCYHLCVQYSGCSPIFSFFGCRQFHFIYPLETNQLIKHHFSSY